MDLIKGGQGRSNEEVETLSEETCWLAVATVLVILAGFVWLGVSS